MECGSEEEDMESPENIKKNIFSLVFGDSDSEVGLFSEDEAEEGANRSDQWVQVDEVEGLWHCSEFLSIQQQTALTEAVAAEGWFAQRQHNQAMRFGDLPSWTLGLCGLIRHSIRSYKSSVTEGLPEDRRDNIGPLPKYILEREPFFDQMIANAYQPGEGIKAHVDLMRFEDGIAIVSLESTCVMSFARVGDGAEIVTGTDSGNLPKGLDSEPGLREEVGSKVLSSLDQRGRNVSYVRERDQKSGLAKRVDVLLKPGDLIVSYGPARYLWTHEIDRSQEKQVWFGQSIRQSQRISVTLRRLCPQRDAE